MKFRSEALEEHSEVPLADGGAWDDVIANSESRRSAAAPRTADDVAVVYVVCVALGRYALVSRGQREEILSLVGAQGNAVAGHQDLRIPEASPRTLLGQGACAEVSERARALGADTVVVDAALSPSQMRNLEDALGLAVRDRESIILDVFLRHARSRRARIQIEVAQLEYLRPRIRGLGLEMDQQAGGLMNARGPGETASELLARRLDGRLSELKIALKKLQRSASEQRRGRKRAKNVALVGYTNAGKSSLMNALTGSELSARNVPFETLDITSRNLTRYGGDVVLSDTVGFIRRLPERLMASFESTLAEVTEADLLVFVVDASDPEWALHLTTTEDLVERLGAGETPRFYVFNKADCAPAISPAQMKNVAADHEWCSLTSKDRDSVARLKRVLVRKVRGGTRGELYVPYEREEVLALVYKQCRVISSQAKSAGMLFCVKTDTDTLGSLRRRANERATR